MAKNYKNKKGATGKKYTTYSDRIKVTYGDGSTRTVRLGDASYAATRKAMESDIGAKKWYKPASKSKTTAETAVVNMNTGKSVKNGRGLVVSGEVNKKAKQEIQASKKEAIKPKLVRASAQYQQAQAEQAPVLRQTISPRALQAGWAQGKNNLTQGTKQGLLALADSPLLKFAAKGEAAEAARMAQAAGPLLKPGIQQSIQQNLQQAGRWSLEDERRQLAADTLAKQLAINARYGQMRGGEKVVSDLIANAVPMVPSLVAGVATGGVGSALGAGIKGAQALNMAGSMAPMFTYARGLGEAQALNEGATMEQANKYGLASGALEAGTEMLVGGVPGSGMKGLLNPLQQTALKGVKGAGLRKGVDIGIDIAGEGLEEAIAEVADPYLQRATYNPNAENASLQDIGYAAGMGMLAGGLMKGGAGTVRALGKLPMASSDLLTEWGQAQADTALLGGTLEQRTAQQTKAAQMNAENARKAAELAQQAQDAAEAARRLPVIIPSQQVQNAPESRNGEVNFRRTGKIDVSLQGSTPKVVATLPMAQRTFENVGDKKVKAYQQENPEVRPFYQETAANLLADLQQGTKGGRDVGINPETRNVTTRGGWQRQQSEPINQMLDDGMNYQQIADGLQRIVEDHGKENTANAKRAELYVDAATRRGYQNVQGEQVAPNSAFAYRGQTLEQLQELNKRLDESFTGDPVKDAAIIRDQEAVQNLMRKTPPTPTTDIRPKGKRPEPIQQIVQQPELNDTITPQPSKPAEADYSTLPDYDLSTLSKEVLDFYEQVGELGGKVHFNVRIVEGMEQDKNAQWDGNGTIYLNGHKLTDEATVRAITAHEVYHAMRGTDEFDDLQDLAIEYLTRKTGKTREQLLQEKTDFYAAHGIALSEDAAFDEITASFMEEALTDSELVFRIGTERPGLCQRLKQWIEDMLAKVRKLPENDLARMQERTLLEAQQLYSEGLQSMQYNGLQQESGSSSYSIGKTTNGDNVVLIEDDIFAGKPNDVKAHKYIADYIKSHIGEVYTLIESGQKVYIGKDLPGEFTQSQYTKSLRGQKSKANAKNQSAQNFGELIEIASNRNWVKNRKTKHSEDAKFGWYRYDTKFALPNGDVYKANLLIRNDTDGKKYLYDLINIKKDSSSALARSYSERLYREQDSPADTTIFDKSTIPQNQRKGNNDVRYSLSNIGDTHKQAQLDIVLNSNPMQDDYHTGIRSVDDICTYAEAIENDGMEGDDITPDYTAQMVEKAKKTGKITVYSSYPIGQGVFVTPSKMEAESYAGGGKVHKKVVSLTDVAWIDSIEGQYAQVNDNNVRYSLSPTVQSLESRLSGDDLLDAQDMIEDIRDSGGQVDENGYVTLYHATSRQKADNIKQTGKMRAKEDGLFFSTRKDGEIAGYGDTVLEFKIPVEKLNLDDVFDSEMHFRLPLKNRNTVTDVSEYLVNPDDIRYSLSGMVDQYGAIPAGENPLGTNRDVQVPKQTNDSNRVRRFTRNAMEAQQVADETVDVMRSDLENDMRNGRFTYEPQSNEELIDTANRKISLKGWEKCLGEFNETFDSGKSMRAEDIAMGERLVQEAQTAGDYQTAAEIIADLAVIGTESGRSIQALKMLKRLTPEGKLMALYRAVDRINANLAEQHKNPVQLPEEIAGKMLQARGTKAQDEIWNEAIQTLANQVPATLADKISAWRYTAMLTNPRTHIRNIIGNGVMQGVMGVKHIVQGTLEKTLPTGEEKTWTFVNRLSKADRKAYRAYLDFAEWDYKQNAKRMLDSGGGRYNDEIGLIAQNKPIFKNRKLEGLRKFNSDMLEQEDMLFKRKTYIKAMARYMKANGLSPSVLQTKAGKASYERAQNYAIEQARKATFQEASTLAQKLNEFENVHPSAKMVAGALIPFKKTPINILKRGLEYSPAGLMKGLADVTYGIKSGKCTPAEAIDSMAAGLTGTGIVALGWFLASLGWLDGGNDDDDKRKANYDRQMGSQNYAIRLPDGSSYTIDWMAPAVMPLMVGTELYNQFHGEYGDSENASGITRGLEAITRVGDPLFEMSMLQGLTNALQSYNSGTGQVLSDFAYSATTGYAGQFIPSVMGAAARTIDDTVRSSYAPKRLQEDDGSTILPSSLYTKGGESFLRQSQNKLPGMSKQNEASIDVWGNERQREFAGSEPSDIAMRVISNFISPGNYSSNKRTELDDKLTELYEKTGDNGVLPKQAQSYIKRDGEPTVYLSPHEYSKLATAQGQKSAQYAAEFVKSSTYQNLDDTTKAEIVAKLYSLAGYEAKKAALKGRGIDYSDIQYENALESGVEPYAYYATRKRFGGKFTDYDTAKKYAEYADRMGMKDDYFAQVSESLSSTNEAMKTSYNSNGKAIKGQGRKDKVYKYLKAEVKAGRMTEEQYWYWWTSIYNAKKRTDKYPVIADCPYKWIREANKQKAKGQ